MSYKCQECDNNYKIDILIPDDLWEKISPKKIDGWKSGGLLCGICIIKKIEELSERINDGVE